MVTGDDPVEGVRVLKDYIVHTQPKTESWFVCPLFSTKELSHFADCIINDKEFDISTVDAKKAVTTVTKLLENIF